MIIDRLFVVFSHIFLIAAVLFKNIPNLIVARLVLQDKMKRLEMELEEEKGNAEMLMDRVNRSRDQIDALRSELLQERSSKQDLELDKTTMERHVRTGLHFNGILSDV